MNQVKFVNVCKGKWAIVGSYFGDTVFAVRKGNGVWELQNEQGELVFGDGFESLANIRAFFA